MIKNLEIENFKSIKHLKLECKRINVFIGEPNTGKSNILEGLGILSFGCYYGVGKIRDFARFTLLNNLFYDENLDESIKIKFDDEFFEIKFEDGFFVGTYHSSKGELLAFKYDYSASGATSPSHGLSQFKFYRFMPLNYFPSKESEFLLPPRGDNLLAVLMAHKRLKLTISQIFNPFGLRLIFKPQENRMEVLKQYGDVFISYPYSLISETLQRVIFHLVAIESNRESIIVFEEPEAHAFPYYTKFLAEKIALERSGNQYFILTHNPYLLFPLLEKSPQDDIAVFIAYFENYQTKAKPLTAEDKEKVMEEGMDIFFNIERFLEEKE